MKAVVVVAQERFNSTEFNNIVDAFKESNIDFQVASNKCEIAFGYIPLSIIPDISIEAINTDDIDCIVIIGGSGSRDYLWENEVLHNKLRNINSQGKIIAAICLAPICLIKAGIIKSGNITAYKTKQTLKIISGSGLDYSFNNVCINQNTITANGPRSANEFAQAIIGELKIG